MDDVDISIPEVPLVVPSRSHVKSPQFARQTVTMAGLGMSKGQVALALGMAYNTFDKYYSAEFNAGASEMRKKLAAKAVEEALGGNTALLLHLVKTKLGWVESQVIEHVGEVRAVVSAKPMTAEDFEKRYLKRSESEGSEALPEGAGA